MKKCMNGTSEIFHRKNMTTIEEKEAKSEIILMWR